MPRLSHNRNQKYVCFDYETNGLSLIRALPWQLAFNISQNGKIISEENHYIWWDDYKMPAYLKAKVHFNDEEYERLARPPEEVFSIFNKYLYDEQYLFVGHNILGYDLGVLYSTYKKLGIWKDWSFINRAIDTLCLARHYHHGTKPSMDNFLGDQMKKIGKPPRGSKKATLQAMCKELGIEFDESLAHNALYDIDRNALVLNQLIYKLDI